MPIVGAKGYEVSDFGRVRSLPRVVASVSKLGNPYMRRVPGGVMVPAPGSHGYLGLKLTMDSGISITRLVHHLVALSFIGPRPDGNHARHLDGDKANCTLENIEYGTPVANAADKVAHGTVVLGEKHHKAKLTARNVREIRLLVGVISFRKIGERFGVGPTAVQKIVEGRNWRHVQ